MWSSIMRFAIVCLCYNIAYTEGFKFRYDYHFNTLADGWLKLHREPATWKDAQFQCYAEGAVLASPLTEHLKKAVIGIVTQLKFPPERIYSGVHATFSKGTYGSVEGVPLSRLAISWAPGEPDNYKNSEECLVMHTQDVNEDNIIIGAMADVNCNQTFPYVCYKRNTALVITECGTSDPDYRLDVRTGHCYKFHRLCKTWENAYKMCEAEGGYLAVVNSDVEATVLTEIFAMHSESSLKIGQSCYAYREVFVGYLKRGYGGTWMTIHGETLRKAGFDKWYSNNPSDVKYGYNCGFFHRSGVFSDADCNFFSPYICEKKPNSLTDRDDSYTNKD